MSIFQYSEVESPKEDVVSSDYVQFEKVPIVIDNGSYQCRAGYSTEESPRLIFKSLVGKVKSTSAPIVGNTLKESEMGRLTLKSPFDSNILVHPPTQEAIFDYIFEKLGITKQIENPIVITEPQSNPSACRKYMSELLFECYNVPSVAYGVDSLFSFYGNRNKLNGRGNNSLIISSGHATTHIYNVQNGNVQQHQTKRINIGGSTNTEYLKKIIHLKYPNHKSYFTQNYTNEIKEKHTYFAKESYISKLIEFGDEDGANQNLSNIIQLPFQEVDLEKLEEEKQRKLQQRKELGQKLKDKMDQKRKEKAVEYEDKLNILEGILQLKTTDSNEYLASLDGEEMTERDLLKSIDELREKLGRKRDPIPEKTVEEEFPLLNIPDESLSAEQIKEKRKQKMLKGARDAKLSAKRKRDEEKEKEEAAAKKEEEEWEKDPELYIKNLNEKRRLLVERMDAREKSKTKVIRRQPKLRSVIVTTSQKGEDEVDEELEQDTAQLASLEKLLDKFDPTWNTNNGQMDSTGMMLNNGELQYETAIDYQIHLGLERIRVPEILYQPKALIGVDTMGLMETISMILGQIKDTNTRSLVASNILLTGGNTLSTNFKDRIIYEMTQIREPGTKFTVVGGESMLDAWMGARQWSLNNLDDWSKVSISSKEYSEYGHDYIKEHFVSNLSTYKILHNVQ